MRARGGDGKCAKGCRTIDSQVPWRSHTHTHISLDEGRAKAAEKYPPELVAAIITGLKKQINNEENRNMKEKNMRQQQRTLSNAKRTFH